MTGTLRSLGMTETVIHDRDRHPERSRGIRTSLAREDYRAVLETTSQGFVRRYPDLWELEG
jgi:hypothetical protein